MKLTLERKDALTALGFLTELTDNRATVPIMRNLLLATDGQSAALTATNLDAFARIRVPAMVEREGSITLEAARLFQIVRALPDGADFTLSMDEEHRVTLKSGRSSFKLSTLPASDFPSTYEGGGDVSGKIAARDLSRLLAVGADCADPGEPRVYFQVTYLHTLGERLRAVSTDGKRAIYCEGAAPGGFDLPGGVMVSPRTAQLMAKMIALQDGADELTLECSSNLVGLESETIRLRSKVIDGQYVQYDRMMASSNGATFTADTDMLIGSLKRMIILASEKDHGVKFEIDEQRLRISTQNDGQESAEEIEVGWSGEPAALRLNAAFLLDMLGHVRTEEVEIRLPGDGVCMSIGETKEGDWRAVLAPFKG